MANFTDLLFNTGVFSALIAGVCVVFYVFFSRKPTKDEDTQCTLLSKTKKENSNGKRNKNSKEQAVQKSRKRTNDSRWTRREKPQQFSHPWHLTTFKGHTGNVLDLEFSSNGKFLATCSDDRTVFLWEVKDFAQKDHKSVRVNIEFDYPTFVRWSPDNKAFLINRFRDGNLEVFKIEKKKDGAIKHATIAHVFPKVHDEELVGMSIASNGRFIMTCSSQNDMKIWDLKGQLITQLDTCLKTTFCAKISPCANFVLASGLSPDAKVWEVVFNPSNQIQEAKRAFELTGHTSGIFDLACNADSSKMITVSQDNTWRIFNTEVYFKRNQVPRLIISGKYDNPENSKSLVALSPNGVIVVAVDDTLQLFSSYTGTLDQTISNIYNGIITRVIFDASGRYLLTTGPRYVMVFHNVTGYKCDVHNAQINLKERQTSATKERLLKIIEDSEAFLEKISE